MNPAHRQGLPAAHLLLWLWPGWAFLFRYCAATHFQQYHLDREEAEEEQTLLFFGQQ